MAEIGNYDDFLPGEFVERIADSKRGQVHHTFQFTDEPWKFFVYFEDGSQAGCTSDELRSVDDA